MHGHDMQEEGAGGWPAQSMKRLRESVKITPEKIQDKPPTIRMRLNVLSTKSTEKLQST